MGLEVRCSFPELWLAFQDLTVYILYLYTDEPSPQTKTYSSTTTLSGHTDWVRDVAWAPSLLNRSYIASCSQDKTVRIWTSTSATPDEWTCTKLDFDAALWRVSWSLSGNVLAVSGGDNRVSLWKEDLKGEWSCAKWIEE